MSEWGVKGTIGIVPPKLPIHSSSPPPQFFFLLNLLNLLIFFLKIL